MSDPLVVLPLVVLLSGAVLSLLAAQWRPAASRAVAVAAVAAALALGIAGLVQVVHQGPLRHHLGGWPPPIGIEYVLDRLSAFLVVVVLSVGLLVLVQPDRVSLRIRPRRGDPAHALVLLLLGGLVGVVVSGDLFHVFVFLEVYALASYALVALGGPRATFAAFRYLLIGTLGGSLYLLGVGVVYFSTGSLHMADVARLLPEVGASPALDGALALIVIGLAVKMALFPLHVWLPGAHSGAPPGVAALLAAAQLKVAAYVLLRIVFGVFGDAYLDGPVPVTTMVAWFGGAAVVVGSVQALRQGDLKRLLAWSTVAQIGLIAIGIGLGTRLAVLGALLHVAAHAATKAGLFFVVGAVLRRCGSTSIASLAGLGSRMPLAMGGLVVGLLSLVGVPPTAGFFSKLLLVQGALDAGAPALAAVVALSSVLTAAYAVRLAEHAFGREPGDATARRARDPGPTVTGPILVTAVATLALGLGNVALQDLLDPVVRGLVT